MGAEEPRDAKPEDAGGVEQAIGSSAEAPTDTAASSSAGGAGGGTPESAKADELKTPPAPDEVPAAAMPLVDPSIGSRPPPAPPKARSSAPPPSGRVSSTPPP